MAIRFLEGFDNYGNFQLNTSSNDPTDNVTTGLARNWTTVSGSWIAKPGRFSGSAVQITSPKNAGFLKKAISATGISHFILGFNIKVTSALNFEIRLSNGANDNTKGLKILYNNSSGNHIIYLNNVLLYTQPSSVMFNNWAHIEMLIPITPSVGNPIRLYINGTERATSATSMSYDGTFTLAVGLYSTYLIDDFYILDDTGAANNVKIGTELYIPRIETLIPITDDTSNFGNANGTVLSTSFTTSFTDPHEFLIPLGCTNISYLNEITSGNRGIIRETSGSVVRTTPAGLSIINTSCWFQFDTNASIFSFWARVGVGQPSTSYPITINNVQSTINVTTTYQQFTFNLTSPSTIKFGPHTAAIYMDDWSLDYTNSLNAREMSQVHSNITKFITSSVNGDVSQFNIKNLSTINNIKGIQLNSLFAESQAAVDGITKFVINNNEVGSNKTVNGTLQSTTPYHTEIFNVNPNTSSTWTETEINNIKIGIKNKS
jgi:hypothetical protein